MLHYVSLWLGPVTSPDDGECPDACYSFDPEDPESLRRAHLALQRRFGLGYLPVLCSEPEPGLVRELLAWLGRKAVEILRQPRGQDRAVRRRPVCASHAPAASAGPVPRPGVLGAAARPVGGRPRRVRLVERPQAIALWILGFLLVLLPGCLDSYGAKTSAEVEVESEGEGEGEGDGDGEGEGEGEGVRSCEPGRTILCYCTGGRPGAQECSADGARWLSCMCADEGEGSGEEEGEGEGERLECTQETWGGHTYAECAASKSWADASAYCTDLGGHLVTVGSAEEDAYAFDLVDRHPRFTDHWMGFIDLEVEGQWEWVTGEPVGYTGWAGGQPSNSEKGEDCAVFLIGGVAGRGWNDASCAGPAPFVCEWDEVLWSYVDADQDGHGNPMLPVSGGHSSPGFSMVADDCDDNDPFVNPDVQETAGDGIDQDCSGADDCFVDADGDGFGSDVTVPAVDGACLATGVVTNTADCDDTDPRVKDVYPVPVAVTATSVFGAGFEVDKLFDGSVCPGDVGVTTYGFTDEFAWSGHAVTDGQFAASYQDRVTVFSDYGRSISADAVLYSNRNKDWAGDRVATIRFWFRDSDFSGSLPPAAPDAEVDVNTDVDGNWISTDAVLTRYELGACFSGRYVAMEFIALYPGGQNIGGSELRLAPCSQGSDRQR